MVGYNLLVFSNIKSISINFQEYLYSYLYREISCFLPNTVTFGNNHINNN